jgi:DUF4097 and DUF4098 domain-containing protein YvlB
MTTTQYETSATPHLTVTCHGDLSIVGSSDNRVLIDIDDDSAASRVDRNGETLVVKSMDDCEIMCPLNSSITIQLASGDLRVMQLTGSLAIESVNGDAKLRELGPVLIKNVLGDLDMRDVEGEAQIDNVRGDALIKHVGGALSINRVSGDLVAEDLNGSVAFNNVSGDVKIETELLPNQTYNATANGDLVLHVLGGGAKMNLVSKGEIRNRLPMTEWHGNDRAATGVLGDGSATVNLVARGDILILSGNGTWGADGISDHVESMIETAMDKFETEMSRMQRQLEERFGSQADRIRRQTDRAKKRAERAAGSWGSFFASSRGGTPPTPPSEPVTDQERMAILKMVEEKKITADEAAKLLAALDS